MPKDQEIRPPFHVDHDVLSASASRHDEARPKKGPTRTHVADRNRGQDTGALFPTSSVGARTALVVFRDAAGRPHRLRHLAGIWSKVEGRMGPEAYWRRDNTDSDETASASHSLGGIERRKQSIYDS